MRAVDRSEILDYVTYDEKRQAILDDILRQKQSRRIHVGSWLTFLFENHDTVRFQIQEMIRVEISRLCLDLSMNLQMLYI